MTELDGQTDIFTELDERPPQLTFTVYEITSALGWPHSCGWCGKGGYQGGGACRWPGNAIDPADKNLGIAYNYCQSCIDKYGHPRVRAEGTPLRLMRYAEYVK